jgi:hypothetical protein
MKHEVSTVFFQLWEAPLFQHMKVRTSYHSSFIEEEGAVNISMGNGREDIEFGGITFVFQKIMGILSAPIPHVMSVHFS